MADWQPCSIRRPIPPSRPAMSCRIGPLSIRSSSAWGSPNSCSGRSTPSAIPTAVTAIPSSATVTNPGASCKSAPCARSTRRGKSSLLTTAGPRCPSPRPPRVRSVRPRSLSPCLARPTTPLLESLSCFGFVQQGHSEQLFRAGLSTVAGAVQSSTWIYFTLKTILSLK